MLETTYQNKVIKKLRRLFPDAIILKNDPGYLQGVPDLVILVQDRWATLEVKTSAKATRRPNQEYYVEVMDNMSFSAFICPENEDEVLDALQQTFRASREACVSKSK